MGGLKYPFTKYYIQLNRMFWVEGMGRFSPLYTYLCHHRYLFAIVTGGWIVMRRKVMLQWLKNIHKSLMFLLQSVIVNILQVV